jgi:hypothetical protein
MKTMAVILFLVAVAASQPHHWLCAVGYTLVTIARYLSG